MGNVSISSSQTKLIQDCWNSDHSNNDKFLKKLDDAIASELAYNCRDEEGHSALHICVIKGREDAVEKLATAFPRLITTSNHKSISPLHSAISLRLFSIASILLQKGDVNVLYQTDNEGNNAFHHTCLVDNFEFLQELFKLDSSVVLVGMKNIKQQSPLLVSIEHTIDPLSYAKAFLKYDPYGVHANDHEGKTALHLAILRNNLPLVKFLIESKSILGTTSKKGEGVLHMAAFAKTKEIFLYLLTETNVPVNSRDIQGNSPLHYAVLVSTFVDCVNMLIQKGADIYFKNRNNQNAFEFLKSKIQSKELNEEESFQEMLQLLEKVYSTSVEKLLPQKTVKLQFCSDIHVEFGTEGFLKPEAPFLALLGDIGLTAESDYRTYLLKQSEKFEKVFVIAGNHEFYNNSIEQTIEDIEKICEEKKDKLIFMNNTAVVIDKVRYLGATLWTKVSEEQDFEVSFRLNDYKKIKINSENGQGKRKLQTSDTVNFHNQTVQWLKKEIDQAKKNGEFVVILTHHCPLWELGCCIASDFGEGIHSAFCTDLQELFGPPVLFWLYGHTHWFNDLTIKDTRIISNPGGYPQENMPFDNSFAIDIPLPN